MANAIAVSKRDIEGMTPLVASRHHDLMKENPAAGELWRGGVSKMRARPNQMLVCGVNNGPLTQYEMPFKLSMTTFQISIMAITPAMASHRARHPSCNFSVFTAKVRSKLVAAE